MQSILVTGGSGFIGTNLVRKLLEKQVDIHVIVRPESNLWRLEPLIPHIFLHKVDLENFEVLQKIIKQISPSVIFHLAAHGVSSLHNDNCKILTSNVFGTFNLLRATKDIDYESFIHVGGSSEYGKKNAPMSEKDVLEPMTFYGLSKACASLLSQQFAFEQIKPITILRPFSVYGPYESPIRLIPTAFEAAIKGKTLKLTSPGFSRDYIFVEDVVEACLLSWEKKITREIINIGTGVQTTNEKVVELIEKITGEKINIQVGTYPPRLSDKPNWVADITKAKELLKWKPRYSIKQGLEKTCSQICPFPTSA